MSESSTQYPVNLNVDYPDRDLNRLTTFFRVFTIIPIGIVICCLFWGLSDEEEGWLFLSTFVVVPTALMILFKQKYPRWWFDSSPRLSSSSESPFPEMHIQYTTHGKGLSREDSDCHVAAKIS